MKLHSALASATASFRWSRDLLLGCSFAVVTAASVIAQTSYTLVDLSAPAELSSANAANAGQAAGYTTTSATLTNTRAALWTGDGLVDLQPDQLTGVSTTTRSMIQGFVGGLQVGTVAGPNTLNRYAAATWRGTAASAALLTIPFTSAGSQALATDGTQIVGYATGLNRDGTTIDTLHAVVWNAATGLGTDLGDGGLGAQATSVGRGLQAGFVYRSNGAVATLWRGTAKSQLVIHPKSAVASILYGTDGVRQVGFAGFDQKRPGETNKGGTTFRYNFASVWSGTDTSWLNIHPAGFVQSYAQAVSGPWIVGYAVTTIGAGAPQNHHAIVWNGALQATDLNAYLPTGYTGAMAMGVDESGTVAGTMFTATGGRHAVVWIPNL